MFFIFNVKKLFVTWTASGNVCQGWIRHGACTNGKENMSISNGKKLDGWITNLEIKRSAEIGAFNLHLLEFTFIYQFYSRKTTLVESTFWNPVGLFAFMSFHNHFKLFWYCVLLKMRGIFCSYLFWDTANGIWTDNIQSFEISFHLSFELQI